MKKLRILTLVAIALLSNNAANAHAWCRRPQIDNHNYISYYPKDKDYYDYNGNLVYGLIPKNDVFTKNGLIPKDDIGTEHSS